MRKNIIVFSLLLILLLAGFFFVWSTTISNTTSTNLVAHESTSEIPLSDTTLNVILFSSDKIFCYTGDINQGKEYSLQDDQSFRQYLLQSKKSYGDSLLVLIKPTVSASYRTTVDMLDEMTFNGIEKYAIVELTDVEKQKFGTSSRMTIPEPVQVKAPRLVSSEKAQIEGLLIEIRSKSNINFYYLDKEQGKRTLESENLASFNMEKSIDKAKEIAGDNELKVTIQATNSLDYPVLKNIIEALQARKIYKYQLITIPE